MGKEKSPSPEKEEKGISPGKEGGIDALQILRIAGGAAVAVFAIWVILHYLLHIL